MLVELALLWLCAEEGTGVNAAVLGGLGGRLLGFLAGGMGGDKILSRALLLCTCPYYLIGASCLSLEWTLSVLLLATLLLF